MPAGNIHKRKTKGRRAHKDAKGKAALRKRIQAATRSAARRRG